MVQVYHLQKAHPDAGRFRLWSLLARSDISERTVGRIMALNKLVYHDIPHVPTPGVKPTPGPHPYKASYRQQYWFIDGRRMDFALEGVRWWSLIILEGSLGQRTRTCLDSRGYNPALLSSGRAGIGGDAALSIAALP